MRRLLIVVDMQKDFIDGALGFEGADAIIPGIIERIAEYKASGDEVVYTMDTHTPEYMNTQEGRNLPVIHCVKGSEGFKLDKALEEHLSGCKAFEKPTFGSMELANYIASNASEYSSIEVCGLVSNICVVSNALLIKAALPEMPLFVDASCCAGVTPESHEAALTTMKYCQITIR